MHPTLSIGWWSLLTALALQLGISAASAQPPLPALTTPAPTTAPTRHVIELPMGTSRAHHMTTMSDLKRVENPNSSVVRVERIADKNNEILLVAENPGRTQITFVDQKDRVEVHEIVVAAAAGGPAGGAEVQSMSIVKGSFKTARLREVPTGGIDNENSKVVRVNQSKDDNRVVTFEALDTGRSRVTFFYGEKKERVEVIDISVVGPETKGVHTVELQVVVAVVNRSALRNMSFSWSHSGPNWFLSSLIGGPGGLATVLTPFAPAQTTTSLAGTGTANLPFGVLSTNNSLLGFLQVLKTEGLTKIHSQPNITTLSGTAASILNGGETPIILATGVGAPPSVTYKEFGTRVNFLPIVMGNGKIHMDVRAELSQLDQASGINVAGINAPGFRTRSAQVKVQVEDGQTLAIGGLIQSSINGTISRVPFLGDLPYLGAVFSTKTYNEVEEELIILVTPRLVEAVDCTRIPKHLPGRETRVPDDFELFLEGILEAPRRPRNVIFHPHYYKGAYHGSSNAGQYPCADGSCHRDACSNCASRRSNSWSSPRVEGPMPSFPEVPAIPTAGPRIGDRPGSFPPIREIPSNLGTPTLPTDPMPPAREPSTRPSLPPITPISR
ncbi:MAG: hypothetical protein HYR84_13920 [Planctomycetes bacterium]|nr:hypothetical protein [Planctomycetota bacterium]